MDRNDDDRRLRSAVEATRLGFGLTSQEAADLARSAARLGAVGICLPLIFLPDAVTGLEKVERSRPELVTVVNFPVGDDSADRVRADAKEAVRSGADHIDLVVPGRLVRDRKWTALGDFIRGTREAAEDGAGREVRLKVILETAALEEGEIRAAAAAAIEAGTHWLKTSTGFHPKGGATVESVRLLRSIAPPEVGVKASGGVRTREDALAMLEAGADRIGTSAEQAILS